MMASRQSSIFNVTSRTKVSEAFQAGSIAHPEADISGCFLAMPMFDVASATKLPAKASSSSYERPVYLQKLEGWR